MTFLALLAGRRGSEPIALACLPPTRTHSTVRALAAASTDICRPELSLGDALALDRQLAALADATAATDPWTAALTTGENR